MDLAINVLESLDNSKTIYHVEIWVTMAFNLCKYHQCIMWTTVWISEHINLFTMVIDDTIVKY